MNLAYTLNKNINLNKIIHDLDKLLQQQSKEELENTVLTISLQKIATMPVANLTHTIESSS